MGSLRLSYTPSHLIVTHVVEEVQLLQVLAGLQQLLHCTASVDRAAHVLKRQGLQGSLYRIVEDRVEDKRQLGIVENPQAFLYHEKIDRADELPPTWLVITAAQALTPFSPRALSLRLSLLSFTVESASQTMRSASRASSSYMGNDNGTYHPAGSIGVLGCSAQFSAMY